MKVPYGITDFATIQREGYIYVDKTKYIPILEKAGRYLFFIRPRRFGKTLFLSTLEHYYDINTCSEFEELFGHLYIGKNPTEYKNSCLILKMNFSGLDTSSKESLKDSFRKTVLTSLIFFLDNYQDVFQHPIDDIVTELKEENDLKRMT